MRGRISRFVRFSLILSAFGHAPPLPALPGPVQLRRARHQPAEAHQIVGCSDPVAFHLRSLNP
jgi:hypothetical protein